MGPAGRPATVSFRFYAQLNDFLPADRRGRRFAHLLQGPASAKDTIEALGVPHPEVDLILANGRVVGFGHPLRDGDAVTVYPTFVSFDLGGLPRLGGDPPDPVRFLADVHLRKLASYLRLAGFDTLVFEDDEEAAARAGREARVLLTRDRELLKRNAVRFGRWIRHADPEAQFAETVERYDLAGRARPFTRCLRCNGLLRVVSKEAVAARLPPRTQAAFHEFRACDGCGRVYWRGSHYARLERILQRALGPGCR